MSFRSYFWNEKGIESEAVKVAFETLSSDFASEEEKVSAFKSLLADGGSVALGIAFDQYFYRNSQTRFGNSNIYEQFDEELLNQARKELKKSPYSGLTNSGDSIVGANYASSLNLLALLGDESDLPLITPILLNSSDESVIWAGCMAASTCLRDAKTAYSDLFAALKRIIESEAFAEATRLEALSGLVESQANEAESMLVEVVQSTDFPINVYAAIGLGERNLERHRNLLEDLLSDLPEDAIYPASDLKDLLDE